MFYSGLYVFSLTTNVDLSVLIVYAKCAIQKENTYFNIFLFVPFAFQESRLFRLVKMRQPLEQLAKMELRNQHFSHLF